MPNITWREFKKLVEDAGIGDDDRIDYIDINGAFRRRIEVQRSRPGVLQPREFWVMN